MSDQQAGFSDDAETPPESLASVGIRSLIDEVREANIRRGEPTLDLQIPNEWSGRVVVRYGRLTRKVLMSAGRVGANADVDLLIAACRGIYIRDSAGELAPVAEALPGVPYVRFDGHLADLFDLDQAADARMIVRQMFKDSVAITAAAKRIIDWQTGANLDEMTTEEIAALVGEDEAAT